VKLSLPRHKNVPEAERPLFIFRQPTRGDGLTKVLTGIKDLTGSGDVGMQLETAQKTFDTLAELVPRMLFGWRNQQVAKPCPACFGADADCQTCHGDGAVYEDVVFDPQHPEKLIDLLDDQDLLDLAIQLVEWPKKNHQPCRPAPSRRGVQGVHGAVRRSAERAMAAAPGVRMRRAAGVPGLPRHRVRGS